jgi:hypothetical protein
MSRQCKPVLLGCRVFASPQHLSTIFADRSALISTRFGSLSLSFAANGLVRGDSTAVLALGESSSKDSGRWWVRGSSICIRWET